MNDSPWIVDDSVIWVRVRIKSNHLNEAMIVYETAIR
jgi:hypothetical protein